MRAALTYSFSQTAIEDMPAPEIGAGEALVRVQACPLGLTARDAWQLQGSGPCVLGRDLIGFIVEVGAGVSRLTSGDRVYVAHNVPCGDCRVCRRGALTSCRSFHWTAIDPGGFAELVRVPADHIRRGGVLRLPRSLTTYHGCMIGALSEVEHAFDLMRLQEGDRLLIAGLSERGLLALQAARARGVSASVWDPRPPRRSLAMRSGAERAIDPAVITDPAGMATALAGAKLDQALVFEVRPRDLPLLTGSLDRGARLCFASPPPPLFNLERGAFFEGLQISMAFASAPQHQRRALKLLRDGVIDLNAFSLGGISLAEVGSALNRRDNEPIETTVVLPYDQ